MPPRFSIPPRLIAAIARDAVFRRKRSFRSDAQTWIGGIRCEYEGEPSCERNGVLYLVNHFSRPGIPAWWGPMAIAARVSAEMHWAMTSAWTYPDRLRARFLTPLSEWFLARLATVYGFTLMPPMPPRPRDVRLRAEAVRRILRLAQNDKPIMGLAPEGMDSPDGRLMRPPPGAGRFIAHLAEAGYTSIPVGVCETGGALHARFGEAFVIPSTGKSSMGKRDDEAASVVMGKIAELLPSEFR